LRHAPRRLVEAVQRRTPADVELPTPEPVQHLGARGRRVGVDELEAVRCCSSPAPRTRPAALSQYSQRESSRVSSGITSQVISAPTIGMVTRKRTGSASRARAGAAASVIAVISG